MTHCDPEFEPLLRNFDSRELDAMPSTVYGLWPDYRLAYLNSSWFRFAEENGGEPRISTDWGLGANAMLAVGRRRRGFFEEGFRACARLGRLWGHRYECPSPRRQREFYMQVHPLGHREGFLVVHSLVIDVEQPPAPRPATPAELRAYSDEHDLIVQCVHCRRVRRVDEPLRWDWVPAWAEHSPENSSGGLCSSCYGIRFGPYEEVD